MSYHTDLTVEQSLQVKRKCLILRKVISILQKKRLICITVTKKTLPYLAKWALKHIAYQLLGAASSQMVMKQNQTKQDLNSMKIYLKNVISMASNHSLRLHTSIVQFT